MERCPKCKKDKLAPYSDPGESWAIHVSPWGTIFRRIESMFTGTRFTDVLRCGKCNSFAYKCPYCTNIETVDACPKHGDRRVCPKCRCEFIMRNPSNFLSMQ